MKRISTVLVLLLWLPIVAFGSQIYGNLRMNNDSVQGVQVRIKCDGAEYVGQTDAYGSYRVPVGSAKAKDCKFSVSYNGRWSGDFAVYAYDDPVRYDFDLVETNGSIALRRR